MKKSIYHLAISLFIIMASCQDSTNQSAESESGTSVEPLTEAIVTETITQLNKALVEKDEATLDKICADGLSYGHSSGAIQDKATFIDDVVNGPFQFLSINTEDQLVGIYEDLATVTNVFVATGVNNGDTIELRIGTAHLYKRHNDGSCKLVLRQGFKL